MADVIARMKVDTKEYDAGLSKATKRLNDFTKQNTSLNGIMAQGMSTLTKLAGGFAAVELAAKGFNAIIMEGSQTTGDFVRNGIGALNDTMGQLAKSIATFDWTPFENGILNVYRDAVSLRRELDNLWNEQVARGTMSAKTQYTVQNARSVLSDANATPEQRKAAQKALDDALADIREANETYTKHLQKVIAQEGEFGTAATNLTFKNVENIYETVAKRGQEEAKAIYQPFHDELKEMQRQLKELEGMDRKVTRVGVYDTGNHSAERKQLKQMIDGYREYYKEELAGWDILERNDNAYQDLANHVNDYYNALSEVEGLQRRANVTSNRLGATGGTGTRGRSTAKAAEPITSSLDIKNFTVPDLGATIFDKAVPSMKELQSLAKYWNDQMNQATSQDQFVAAENALKKIEQDIALQPIALRGGITIAEAEQQERLQAQCDEMRLQIKADVELSKESLKNADGLSGSGKSSQKSWEAASRAISSAGNALQELNNTSFNIAGTIMQAIADVALSMAQALASPATGAAGIFGWIAGAAAGTATMIATIAAIKSATSGSYAQGGIVPGVYNGGLDSTYVYASPGEVILNRAQQENLLSQLEPATASGGTSYVSGEQLITVINNTGRRRGRGELIFG